MHLPPIEVLLSWPSPNYQNPVTRGDALLVVNSVFLVLAIVTVALRMYTRTIIKRWLGIDDLFIILALLFTIGLTAIVLLANQDYGWDRHVYDIELSKTASTLKIAMVAKVIFTAAATFTRLSLHCLYYRLVQDSGITWFKWVIHVNVAYTLGIFISFPFIAVFLCTPVSNYWTLGAPTDSCLDEGIATLVCGVISTIADFATTVTPIPIILGLHMPLRQRMGVVFLFALGMVVTVAGIVRTWYIYKSLIAEYDSTWYAYPLWIAAAVEIDLGVICASAPVLRPLLAKIPFSLSGTFSRGISLTYRKFTSHNSSSSKKPTTATYSTLFSKNPIVYSPKNSDLSSTLASDITTLNSVSISIPLTSVSPSKHCPSALPPTQDLHHTSSGKPHSPTARNLWDDIERGIVSQHVEPEHEPEPEPEPESETLHHHRSSNSQDVILGIKTASSNESRPAPMGLMGLWPWGRVQSSASRQEEEQRNTSMTITRTEEFELRNEEAETRKSKYRVEDFRL